MENSIKSISTINEAIMENTESSIIKVRVLVIDQKWVYDSIMVHHHTSFPTTLNILSNISSDD